MRKTYSTSLHRRTLYRSRNGVIFGVCGGLADYAEISICWVRCIALAILFLSGFFPIVLIYLVAAFFMKPEPVMKPTSDDDWEFYNSLAVDRSKALARIKRKFDQLERRTRRMENMVTARAFDWEERFQNGG